jgi:excisionase family DNA binding protein
MTPQEFGLMKAAYSVNETLNLLSIGRTTFYQLVDRGDIALAKIGKKSLVYAVDIAAFLAKLKKVA